MRLRFDASRVRFASRTTCRTTCRVLDIRKRLIGRTLCQHRIGLRNRRLQVRILRGAFSSITALISNLALAWCVAFSRGDPLYIPLKEEPVLLRVSVTASA